jgi:hypothetical protein
MTEFRLSDENSLLPKKEFERLEEALTSLEQQQARPSNEAWFHLELQVDHILMRLLICTAGADADLSPLVENATGKLSLLSEGTLVEQWGRVQSEFDPDRVLPHFDEQSPLLPQPFLELPSSGKLRHKLASYVIQLKPKLVAERIRKGLFSHPSDALGPARLLAINTTVTALERDVLRLDLARSVGRVVAVWTHILNKKESALATLLGLEPGTRLMAGPDVRKARTQLGKASEPAAAAIYEVERFLAAVERLSGSKSGVETALRRHKMGLEVGLPESAVEVRGANELKLQKRLCRFLLEHGLYVEGTKFGPFESDLVASVRAIATVIEVKLFGAGSRPVVKSFRSALAQLQDYMDKRPVRPSGVLAVYNLSDVLIVPPNRWIRGRYWITVVNLGLATGSRRRATLTLEEDQSGRELIVGHTNNAQHLTGENDGQHARGSQASRMKRLRKTQR